MLLSEKVAEGEIGLLFDLCFLLKLEACNMAGVNKIQIPHHFVRVKFSILRLEICLTPKSMGLRAFNSIP